MKNAMRKMRKIVVLGVALTLMLTFTIGAAHAAETVDPHPSDAEAAQMLYDLHLFRGTENGFELERLLTRGEAAVMMVRFLGAETEVLEAQVPCPFTDAADWLKPYLGWLYDRGLVNGTGEGLYSPDLPITYEHFGFLCARAANPTDYMGAITSAVPNELYPTNVGWELEDMPTEDDYPEGEFVRTHLLTRGEACRISFAALELYCNKRDTTISRHLLNTGVFTLDEVQKTLGGFFGMRYFNRRFRDIDYIGITRDLDSGFYTDGYSLYYTPEKDDNGNITEDILIHSAPEGYDGLYSYRLMYIAQDHSPNDTRYHRYLEDEVLFCITDAKEEIVGCYLYNPDEYTLSKMDIDTDWLFQLEIAGYYTQKPMAYYVDRHNVVDGKVEAVVYFGNHDGLYIYEPKSGDLRQLHTKGVCKWYAIAPAPGGVVYFTQDGEILYTDTEGVTVPIFEQFWGEKLTWGCGPISYDGTTLRMIYPANGSYSMGGHGGASCYTLEVSTEGVRCVDYYYLYDNYYRSGYSDDEHHWERIDSMNEALEQNPDFFS